MKQAPRHAVALLAISCPATQRECDPRAKFLSGFDSEAQSTDFSISIPHLYGFSFSHLLPLTGYMECLA
jgi:hypothetical protein